MADISVKLKRIASDKDGTFGVLVVNGKALCVTCEEEWLDNRKSVSCIPPGRYTVRPHNGAKYKNVWILEGTSPREAILIHWGNTKNNTAGCILMGQYFADFNGLRGVANSMATIEMLRKVLPPRFTLDIVDCTQ